MAVKKSDIVAKLSEMGAEFEESAKVDDLRALFTDEEMAALESEVAARDEAAKSGLIKCVILRDFWDKDGKRQPAGKEVDLTAEDAMDGVESGALSRVKK
tara:strand:- start:402 stop:701 length:300 start_codon:yes stop_codon:yes gene_type:complete